MRRFARPLCAVIALISALAQADAASLNGEGLDFTSAHRSLAPYLGSASLDAAGHGLDEASLQSLDPLNPAMARFGRFTPAGLEGIGALDAASSTITMMSVGAASSAVKLTNSDLLFNPSFSVSAMVDPTADLTRLVGAGGQSGDEAMETAGLHPRHIDLIAGGGSSVPLPPALPLLAAAILALAAFGYGLNRWVAPRGAK